MQHEGIGQNHLVVRRFASEVRLASLLLPTFTVLFAFSPALASIAACNQLIELSRVSSQTSTSADDFEQYQRSFCHDYAQSKTTGSSMSAGASYGPMSGSYGQAKQSVEQTADHYCAADGSTKQTAQAYANYVQSIAPGAYSSYEACLRLANEGINFEISQNAILPLSATFIVHDDVRAAQGVDKLVFQTSPDVSCDWGEGSRGSSTDIRPMSMATLTCHRESSAHASYIVLLAATRPDAAMSIPWSAYDGELSVSVKRQFLQSSADLQDFIKSIKGAVVAFDARTCPAGWTTYLPGQGRFVRGITTVGDIALDPEGARLPGSLQGDLFRSHYHSRPLDVYDAGGGESGHWVQGAADGASLGFGRDGPAVTGSTGGEETRPKNVALLYCIRN